MPALENQRHEKFAQALAQGMSAAEAYVSAGYAANDGNAIRLKGNERVQARVRELLDRAATNVSLSREWVLEQLIDNARRAKENGDISPANRALELLGKELGMFVDRSENLNQNVSYVISGEPIADADEWLEQHRPN
jgi:phage terminase small subunit